MDSTKLSLTDKYYVITRKEYDSQTGVTKFFLTPHDASSYTLNPEKHLDGLMDDVRGRLGDIESRMERLKRYTDKWSA